MHTEALHKQNLNTEELLQTEAGTQRNFHKQKLLTHRGRFTQTLLHTEAFTQKTFTQRSFYPQKLLHTEAFMQRSFYAKKLLYREVFTHLSSCLIFHDHSPAVTFISSFHALLVNSLRGLVFISHGVLSVHASSSLPLRKLNENPEINSD